MQDQRLDRRRRLALATVFAVLAAAYVLWFDVSTHQVGAGGSDFDQLWYAARALWEGRNPYAVIGPGREFQWSWPLVYPLPTVVATLPFAALPLLVARVLFATLSVGVLAYAVSRRGYAVLPVMGSAAVMDAARAAQMSPLLTAGLVLGGAAVAFVLKPHTGLLLLVASPRRSAMAVAVASGVVLAAFAFVMQPLWLTDWRSALGSASHMRAPVMSFGGPLLLLAALRWRRLDARVLLASALVPHTPMVYDVVPLALIARTFRESLLYALLTHAALFAQDAWVTGAPPDVGPTMAARILNVCVYLPALAAILARPNESEGLAADGYLARWTTRGRNRTNAVAP